MNIALVANDVRKELMIQLCIRNCSVLSRHNLFSTSTTGQFISSATGLKFGLFLRGENGGYEQIGTKIAYGEIDLVIYLRDTLRYEEDRDGMNLIRLCDIHNIPVATNLASAEVFLKTLNSSPELFERDEL